MRIPRSRRWLGVIGTLILCFTIFAGGTVSASTDSPTEITSFTTNAGICSGGGNHQKYADRYSSYIGDPYFDYVEGTATAQQLEVCAGSSSDPPEVCNGGTWVLPANIQTDGGTIHQLGYGRCSGEGSNYLVYAHNSATPHRAGGCLVPAANSSCIMLDDHVYKFVIYKRSTGRVSFAVNDMSAGGALMWSYYPTTAWSSSLKHAWWGYETTDIASDHGHSHGDGDYIRIHDMIYNGSNDNVYHWRQPSSAEIFCTGTGCYSNHHTHLSTTTYASDTFDADTGP